MKQRILDTFVNESIHAGEKTHRMDLTEDEAHGLLFDREDDKGNFLFLSFCQAPGET